MKNSNLCKSENCLNCLNCLKSQGVNNVTINNTITIKIGAIGVIGVIIYVMKSDEMQTLYKLIEPLKNLF